MAPSGKILLVLLHSSEVYMRVKKSKTAFILFASFFIFSACDFNNLRERIVITEENNELPETEVETETELPLENEPKPKKLLLLVYMAADNDLESFAIQNLKQMEHAVFRDMELLVLLDRAEGYDETNGNWTDTRLFEVCHDDSDSSLIVSKRLSCSALGLGADCETELDLGNYTVLKNFINFGKTWCEAEQYALIIWGHGTGWRAVAIDDRTNTFISVKDLGLALKDQGLSVIGFDTCFGGVIENLFEIKDSSQYIVASPGITPSGGWDYKKLLETISESNFSTESLANAMAESSSALISVFTNSKLSDVMTAFEDFSEKLSACIYDNSSRQNIFTTLFGLQSYNYSKYPCDMYLDLAGMAEYFINDSANSQVSLTVKTCAEKLQMAVNEAVNTSNSADGRIGVHFIPMTGSRTAASSHSSDYIKDSDNSNQCSFIQNSEFWVPTKKGDSESLLDKLFYAVF